MENLFPKNLYHSYIVEGDPVNTSQDLLGFLIERGEMIKNSPDLFLENYDSLTIDDSRKIKKWHSELGIDNNKRICIIATNFINHEAQRALLKMIEEPASNTHLFIIVPNSLLLLDTIRSRAHTVKTFLRENNNFKEIVEKFISLPQKNKITFISNFIKKNKDNLTNSKQRSDAILFINEIEKIYFQKFQEDKKNKELQFILKEIQEKREYLNLPGSSIKMILEHLALML